MVISNNVRSRVSCREVVGRLHAVERLIVIFQADNCSHHRDETIGIDTL